MAKHHFQNSTSIAHCDYDNVNKTIEICFHSGATHRYEGCSQDVFEGLKKATSPGKFFHENIRKLKSIKV